MSLSYRIPFTWFLFGLLCLITPRILAAEGPAQDAARADAEAAQVTALCLRLSKVTSAVQHASQLPKFNDSALYNLTTLTSTLRQLANDGLINEADRMLETLEETPEKAKLQSARNDLINTIDAIPTHVKGLLDAGKAQLGVINEEALGQCENEDDAAKQRQLIIAHLPHLRTIVRLYPGMHSGWSATLTEMKKVRTIVDDPLATDFSQLASTTGNTLNAIDLWLGRTKANVDTCCSREYSTIVQLRNSRGPDTTDEIRLQRSLEAQVQWQQHLSFASDLDAIIQAWTALCALGCPALEQDGFTFQEGRSHAGQIKASTEQLHIVHAMLRDELEGDAAQFVVDQVPLYYFTDIKRLMKALNVATIEVESLQGVREHAAQARRALADAEQALIDAQAAVHALLPQAERIQQQVQQASRKVDLLDSALTKASQAYERALARTNATEAERTSALHKRDELQTQKTDAETELSRARTQDDELQRLLQRVDAAKKEVARCRVNLLLTAQEEVEAFAQARDNAPFLFTPAMAISQDPVKRVRLFAYSDSKTILLRGPKDDIEKVKQLIASFDKPAPQARLTLWTLELNCQEDRLSIQRFNSAIAEMEQRMAYTRTKMAAATQLLRKCINDEVNRVAAEPQAQGDGYFRRLSFYNPEVVRKLGAPSYPRVLSNSSDLRLVRQNLPDPAGGTTLGEALLILSLGQRRYQQTILANFEQAMQTEMGKVKPPKGSTCWFPSLYFAIGLTPKEVIAPPTQIQPASTDLTHHQLEIVRALQRMGVLRSQQRLTTYSEQLQLNANEISATPPSARVEILQGEQRILIDRSRSIIVWIFFDHNDVSETDGRSPALVLPLDDTSRSINLIKYYADKISKTYPTSDINARIAAADQMLKEMICALDEDLERNFTQPMLDQIRAGLSKRAIQVGILQRNSVLATNRQVARSDPRGAAQLAVGEDIDALRSTVELVNLYTTFNTGGLGSLLGSAMPQLKAEAPKQEFYGVSTGSEFRVTPVIDPSGQALRFRFDYVMANRVREPDGSTDAALPRIERHTINTEVQLSNLEMRNIAQFDAKARLGIAPKKSGGLPVFKDIPVVGYVPLLGWFSLRTGKAAVTQQSIVFAQATVYPTIESMTMLLASPSVAPNLANTNGNPPIPTIY